MADFDLNSFLSAQLSEGTSHGEGDFTISHEKAAQKMREYSLPREQAWVLKLLQAAVAWDCQEIILKQSRNDSIFFFPSEQTTLPTNQEIVGSILRADPESHSPLESFGVALRILVEKLHLSFLLLVDDGQPDPQAIYAGVYFGEMTEGRRAEERRKWPRGITLRIHHIPHTEINRLILSHLPFSRQAIPMYREIEQYAYTCPVPLTIDGRRMDGILRSSSLEWQNHRRPVRLAGVELPGDQDPKWNICGGFNNQILSLRHPILELASHNGTSPPAEAFLLLAVEVDKHSYAKLDPAKRCAICWVRHGVVVDEYQLPIETELLQLKIFLPAHDLRSDLTGFQLIRNDEYRNRIIRACDRVAEVLQLERLAQRDIFAPPPRDENEEERESTFLERGSIGAFLGAAKHEAAQNPGSLEAYVSALVAGARAALKEITRLPFEWDILKTRKRYQAELEAIPIGLAEIPLQLRGESTPATQPKEEMDAS